MRAKVGSNICRFGDTLDASQLLTWYSYGMVLAKEKNDEKAMQFFIQSVHKYTMNWGCWLEMTSLISRVDYVSLLTLTKRALLMW